MSHLWTQPLSSPSSDPNCSSPVEILDACARRPYVKFIFTRPTHKHDRPSRRSYEKDLSAHQAKTENRIPKFIQSLPRIYWNFLLSTPVFETHCQHASKDRTWIRPALCRSLARLWRPCFSHLPVQNFIILHQLLLHNALTVVSTHFLNQPPKCQNMQTIWPSTQLRNFSMWEPMKPANQTNFPNYHQTNRTIGRLPNFEILASRSDDDPVADTHLGTGSAVFGACR